LNGIFLSIPYSAPQGVGIIPLFLNVNGVSSIYYFDAGSTGITDPLQMETRITGNYPNPFNPETTIAFTLRHAGPVRVEVYNARGQQILVLTDGLFPAGVNRVTWNGTDSQGRPVASGVYLYRFRADGRDDLRKMLLLK
jgi:hypothetical protein